jgi:hypothetical protein
MKKVLYLAALLFSVALTSCEKEEVGGTATQDMAGDWYVTVDAVDANGDLVYSDEEFFGLGRIHVLTANTAANKAGEMILTDQGAFWGFSVKVSCDPQNLTFKTTTTEVNNLDFDEINVSVTDGKIVKNGGVQNNGSVSDYIEFYINFSDDSYPEKYGFAKYHVYGVRYSGLVEND